MTLSKVSIIAVCGLQLLVAGCKEEPTQPPPNAQKVEVMTSDGLAVVFPVGEGSVKDTNGNTIPAVAQIVSVSVDSQTKGRAKEPTSAARMVVSNGTYDWNLGATLINGTNAGTNVAVSIRPRITGVARELAPTNQPAR